MIFYKKGLQKPEEKTYLRIIFSCLTQAITK